MMSLFMLAAVAAPCCAQSEAGITPYRPSVSSPAQLPLAGQLEFEIGGLSNKAGGVRRDSLPYTFKLAFDEQWGVLISGESYVSLRAPGAERQHGAGDTTLVLKRAYVQGGATGIGLELGWKLPTAKDTIGSGKSDLALNGIVSRDIGAVHLDANLNATRLGAIEPGSGRVQTGLSASFSTPVSEQWGLTAELAGSRRNGVPHTAQLLCAAAYSPTRRLTVDVGVARGLAPASRSWSLFSGLVVPLAKLW